MKKKTMPLYIELGKREYVTVDVQEQAWIPCYSAKQLEGELRIQLCGQKLCAILADLNGCLGVGAPHWDKDIMNMSYLGGAVIFVFERTAFQILFEVSGVLIYRCFPVWEMVVKRTYDYLPDDMILSERYYIDIGEDAFSVRVKGRVALDVVVTERTEDDYGFASSHFNRELLNEAAEKRELPSEVSILFDGFRIRIEGDIIENYQIYLENTHRE